MKILIVDDTKLSRNMLKKRLPASVKESASIIEGCNGEEAVNLFQEHSPDIVFLDLTMPIMNGFDALALIKAHNPAARVHVVSADVQEGSRERIAKLGAASLEPKPVSEQRLAEIFTDLSGEI